MGVRRANASRNRSGRSPAGWWDKELSSSLFGGFAKFRKATISFLMSVRLSVHMAELVSHWKNLNEMWYWSIFRKYFEKIRLSLQSPHNNGTSREDRYTFFIITRSILLIMQNLSEKFAENKITYFIFSVVLFENRAVCEIMWKM